MSRLQYAIWPAGLKADLDALNIVLKRSARRKTLGLKVRAGEVVVFAPTFASDAHVMAWVNSKAQWILKHAHKPLGDNPSVMTRAPLNVHSEVFWLGRKVALGEADKAGLSCIDAAFFERSLADQKVLLLNACATAAKDDLAGRVTHWQAQLQLYPKQIKLRPYKSCWGSCNHNGVVALNTLLMMAPETVRNYVVVHELCHLKHLNHSSAFWAEVAKGCKPPVIRSAKRWLKEHGEQLLFIYR